MMVNVNILSLTHTAIYFATIMTSSGAVSVVQMQRILSAMCCSNQ